MYEVKVSFTTGAFSAAKGETIEIEDKAIAKDLVDAGYVVEKKTTRRKR